MKNGIISALLVAGAVFAQENYSTAWTGHKNVIINTQAIGVASNQVNFPVLIRLAAADSAIFAAAKAGGADLRFTKANNTTRLSHHIESWNATTKTAVVWVLADTILGNKNNNVIRMHWGNASAVDSSSGSQVFRTTAGFQAVWHLNGTANDSDVTSNGIHLTASAASDSVPASAAGAINGARVFSGNDYLRAVGSASGPLNFPLGGNYSISAWINAQELASHGVIVSKHDNQYAFKLDQNNNLEFFEFNGGWNAVNAPADVNAWLHVVGVQNGADAKLYINGANVDAGLVSTASGAARVENIDVVVGAEPTTTSIRRFFIGSIDELRMHSASRSADWAKLEYNTQRAGQTTVKLLDTVPAALSRGVFTARNGLTVKAMGNGLQFRIEGAHAAKARVAVMDMWGRTVWSRLSDVTGNTVSWDGRAANGQLAPQGVYAVRITLLNAQGRTTQVLEQKVPFTR